MNEEKEHPFWVLLVVIIKYNLVHLIVIYDD